MALARCYRVSLLGLLLGGDSGKEAQAEALTTPYPWLEKGAASFPLAGGVWAGRILGKCNLVYWRVLITCFFPRQTRPPMCPGVRGMTLWQPHPRRSFPDMKVLLPGGRGVGPLSGPYTYGPCQVFCLPGG